MFISKIFLSRPFPVGFVVRSRSPDRRGWEQPLLSRRLEVFMRSRHQLFLKRPVTLASAGRLGPEFSLREGFK